MRGQLYLYKQLRLNLQEPYQLFIKTYQERIEPIFDNIEKESDKIGEKFLDECSESFNPDCDDPSDYYEAANDRRINYYENMSLMKYNTKLMWISTTFQFWEQQVRKFLYKELKRTHIPTYKDGTEKPFRAFCSNGFFEIEEKFNYFGQDLNKLNSWNKINELRLLTNTIKHGDGPAAKKLKKIRKDIFECDFLDCDLLELNRSTLTEITLNVTTEDFIIYCNSLIEFWEELPERLYLIKD